MVLFGSLRHNWTVVVGCMLFWLLTPLALVAGTGNLDFHWSIHFLQAVPVGLLIYGFFLLHRSQEEATGSLELYSLLISLAGMFLIGGIDLIQGGMSLFRFETLPAFSATEQIYPLGYVCWLFGSIAFGIATLRANVLPKGGAWLCIIGPVVIYGGFTILALLAGQVPITVTGLVLYIIFAPWLAGWFWLGTGLQAARSKILSDA